MERRRKDDKGLCKEGRIEMYEKEEKKLGNEEQEDVKVRRGSFTMIQYCNNTLHTKETGMQTM